MKLSIPRGNPSIRNFFVAQPCFSIAAFISRQGISPGTSAPAFIMLLIISPFSEPLATSSLSKSPADKCMKPKLATSFAHYVPLPEPGPPRTNKTIGLSCSDFIILICFTDEVFPIFDFFSYTLGELLVTAALFLGGCSMWCGIDN